MIFVMIFFPIELGPRGAIQLEKKSSRKSSRKNFTSKSYNKKIKLDFRDDFHDEFRDDFFSIELGPCFPGRHIFIQFVPGDECSGHRGDDDAAGTSSCWFSLPLWWLPDSKTSSS